MSDEADAVVVELSQREVALLLRYGYPFDEEKTQLQAFGGIGPHQLTISRFNLSMMIAELVRSAKTIRSDNVLEELDRLCSALESAEDGQPRIRAVR